MRYWLLVIISLVLFVAGCTSHDSRLARVGEIVNESPGKAIVLLDSIDRSKLTESDRYLYDLMMVKANDKSYIKHTTDSLILLVKEYYSRDRQSDEYLEAVYYCGRVSSDLGDYPSAMKYYQEVIELTEEDKARNRLQIRGNALAFIEHRLTYLDLYEESIPYLNEVIRIDSILKDTVNLIDDYKSLGYLYMVDEKYELAEITLRKGLNLTTGLDKFSENLLNTYLGGVNYRRGEYKLAMDYLSKPLSQPDSISESVALTYAAYVHYDCAQYDSAAYYACKLVGTKDTINKKNGYDILLRPELRHTLGLDSANKYIFEYRELLTNEMDGNKSRLTLIQNAQYNYDSHKRAKERMEEKNLRLTYTLYFIIVVIILNIASNFIQQLREKNKMLRFYEALSVVVYLQRKEEIKKIAAIEEKNEEVGELRQQLLIGYKSLEKMEEKKSEKENVQSLRTKLTKELMYLQQIAPEKYLIPEYISQSTEYEELLQGLSEKKSKEYDYEFWKQLEKRIVEGSPLFIKNLTILLGGKLKEEEKQIAMLIKCGLTPSEMMIVLSKEKGTISSRRIRLGLKAFDIKLSTKVVDRLIRLL